VVKILLHPSFRLIQCYSLTLSEGYNISESVNHSLYQCVIFYGDNWHIFFFLKGQTCSASKSNYKKKLVHFSTILN